MRWGLFWIGALLVVIAFTVHAVQTAERPIVVDGVIRGREAPAKIAASPQAPADRAEAHAANLDPAERRAAQDELAAASAAVFAARTAIVVTRGDILHIETNRAAAQHRWEAAMERLYGPTWEAWHARTQAEARQASDGMASRFGYSSSNSHQADPDGR